jgi:hypothetical protein
MSTSMERRRERRHGKVKQETFWIPVLGRSIPLTHIGIRSRDGAVIVYDRPTSDPLRNRIYVAKP